MRNDQPISPKLEAQAAHDFLETRFGKHFIEQLSMRYNVLHQSAEREKMTSEQKAMKVERAAGVKFAIDWLVQKDQQLAAGMFPPDKPTPEVPAEQS